MGETEVRQPNPMEQRIQQLEARNIEMGGILFATFGKDSGKALVFPTPGIRVIRRKDEDFGGLEREQVKEFAVVTLNGLWAIQADADHNTYSWAGEPGNISSLIESRMGKKSAGGIGHNGFEGVSLKLGGWAGIYITEAGTRKLSGNDDRGCRLAKIPPGVADAIIGANIERVEKIQASLGRANERIRQISVTSS